MVMENNAIDGTPAEVTTHMDKNMIAYGDWSQLYIGQWGAIDLTVDNYTQATKGCVRLVINAFFDYKVVRDGAIVLGEYTTE
jgi:HK97 family phage major capsid protein